MSQLTFTRRLILKGSVVSIVGLHLSGCKVAETHLFQVTEKGQYFSAQELTLLNDIAELMLPPTDTAGAADANVAAVLDGMMISWASENIRKQFKRAIMAFDIAAQNLHKTSYEFLTYDKRLNVLIDFDTSAFKKPTSDQANSQDYRHLKELIFLIYYSSEEANDSYVAIPGEYFGDLTQNEYEALMSERQHGG